MQDSPTTPCVLRLFSGPLQGCEFILERPRTLFVVGAQASLGDPERALQIPEDAIYVPLAAEHEQTENFEVLLQADIHNGCIVRALADTVTERVLAFQVIHRLAGLQIALRRQDQTWDPRLLSAAPTTGSVVEWLKQSHGWHPWLRPGVAASLLMLVLLLTGAWYGFSDHSRDNVEKLVAGSAGALQVVHGSDRQVYVFADNERDLNWARQVMARNGHPPSQVLTPYLERARLQHLLAERMPRLAWYRIDFSDVRQPRLWISSQRNHASPSFDRTLQTLLQEAAPYARHFHVQRADDHDLTQRAEQSLVRLALPFERSDRADGVTFTVRGSLQDAELSAIRSLVNEFYRQWGDRYVHFAVELQDNWLAGKSFQYGPQGYIKMTPSSWHFPQPL